ncbi:MAG: hypothetical protein E7249_15280 [Paenibacillaceae bacterium]|nr:hypothetical protein [Paenibacillaceae bacterium]
MIDDTQQLYLDSLSEIAEALGHSFDNPISISLLCLTLGITNEEKGKIYVAFNQVLRLNEFDKLSVQLFRNELENIISNAREFNDIVVIALIKAFARNLIAELVPFARSL